MLRRITDMPGGTIGFEAIGEVEDDDWERAVEPVLRREIGDGRHKIRLLYLLGPEARVEGDAMTADTGFRARHAMSFDRVAVVSDEDWIRPALRGLSFLLPGKARGFPVRELAPLQREDGSLVERNRGTPRGSAISLLLAERGCCSPATRSRRSTRPPCTHGPRLSLGQRRPRTGALLAPEP